MTKYRTQEQQERLIEFLGFVKTVSPKGLIWSHPVNSYEMKSFHKQFPIDGILCENNTRIKFGYDWNWTQMIISKIKEHNFSDLTVNREFQEYLLHINRGLLDGDHQYTIEACDRFVIWHSINKLFRLKNIA